jgi:phosphoenolpyruvate carboxykinase (GTP)
MPTPAPTNTPTNNPTLLAWVSEQAALCTPDSIHWCDGSPEEAARLCDEMIEHGTAVRLDPQKRPNSFLCRSAPDDVARVEHRTFICCEREEDAGPTNNWREPAAMKAELRALFDGCMAGRTMFVIPFSLGPLGSPLSRIGIEISDSPYVVCNMRLVTRVGAQVLASLGDSPDFVRCLHSVGAPLGPGEADVPWPDDVAHEYITHFPQTREVISYGSGYGGNALLGKKCFALRIASVLARHEGWLAEHMLILGITNPQGQKKYFAAAFPSQCGKTNLAMMTPALPGWKVETVGDDIAWMRWGEDGRLRAINPEAGFFGVAPGTGAASNPNAMASIQRDTIFTNVAQTVGPNGGDVWWEGMTPQPPEELTSWLGEPWTPASETTAAHPNGRFTVAASNCPSMDPSWEDPAGVPIEAILFGGRRPSTVPLAARSLSWEHGVFMGSTVASETTAAAAGATGRIRRDPFAMLPFCGYHMADYFAHWLSFGSETSRHNRTMPAIFGVNWFRKGAAGEYLWPGYGENARVLKWIFENLDGVDNARQTPIGWLPHDGALDLEGLPIEPDAMRQLLEVDAEAWQREARSIREFYATFGAKLPRELSAQLHALEERLAGAEGAGAAAVHISIQD